LRGHASIVTAVKLIENTPMVVSVDDVGFIKVKGVLGLGSKKNGVCVNYRTRLLKYSRMYFGYVK